MSASQPPPPPPGPPGPPPGGGMPPGGYGATPPGGYGATPPGGYGATPPGGYGGGMPPGGQAPWDLGSAVSYGWNKFQQNMGQMIIATLAIFLGAVVILGAGIVLTTVVLAGDTECRFDDDGVYRCDAGGLGFFGTMLIMAITFGLFFIYAQVVGAGIIRGSLGVTEGRPFKAAEVFKFDRLGPVLVTSIIVGVGIMIGTVLCYLPGLVIGFLCSYALYFVVDKNLAPMDAIKASFELVKNNIGTTLIWYIVGGLIGGAGAILCGVGILFTLPIMLIGTAYTYKKLTGQPVAA